MEEVLSGAGDGGTLVVPGSGAFVRQWQWLPGLICGACERFERVVVLPSSYDPTVPVVARALAEPNVYPFAREPVSYRAIKDFGRAVLAFDPALYAWDFVLRPRSDSVDSDKRGLVSLRTDAGSVLHRARLVVHPERKDELSVSASNLDAFLERIRTADRVVTDRLQVVVASIMTGTSVDYVDPYDREISSYLDFTFGRQVTGLVVRRELRWLLESWIRRSRRGGLGMGRVLGCVMARDEWPLLGLAIEHALAGHVEHVVVLDHASTDGSRVGLNALRECRPGQLTVIRLEDPYFNQEAATALLIKAGPSVVYDWVYVFDADEFILPGNGRRLGAVLDEADAKVDAVRYEIHNWVTPRDFDGHDIEGYPAIRTRAIPNIFTETGLETPDGIERGYVNFFDAPFPLQGDHSCASRRVDCRGDPLGEAPCGCRVDPEAGQLCGPVTFRCSACIGCATRADKGKPAWTPASRRSTGGRNRCCAGSRRLRDWRSSGGGTRCPFQAAKQVRPAPVWCRMTSWVRL